MSGPVILYPGESGPYVTPSAESWPNDIVFGSDWSSLTGQSTNAVQDYLQPQGWTNNKGIGEESEVVTCASTGADWPTGMVNCLAIRCLAPNSPDAGVYVTGLGDLPVGHARHTRFYVCYVTPDSPAHGDNENHPVDEGTGGGGNQTFNQGWWNGVATNKWTPSFNSNSGGTQHWGVGDPANNNHGDVFLDKGVVYQIEMEQHRTSDTGGANGLGFAICRAWIGRVESDGSVTENLYVPSDMKATRAGWLENTNLGNNVAIDVAPNTGGEFNARQCGSNGWAGDPGTTYDAWYFGAWLMRQGPVASTGRCPVYNATQESV